MPGIALATCGDLHTQRPSPRQDTESQKANPFIPEAQTAVLLKNSRHLLGFLRLFSSGGPPIPDCSACLLAMPHFTFKSIPGAYNPRPFPHWQGTPVPEVKEQEQEGHLYFPGKPAPRPPPLPKGLENSEQTTQLSRDQSPSTGPNLPQQSAWEWLVAKAEVTWPLRTWTPSAEE